jgi:hypothetical protein
MPSTAICWFVALCEIFLPPSAFTNLLKVIIRNGKSLLQATERRCSRCIWSKSDVRCDPAKFSTPIPLIGVTWVREVRGFPAFFLEFRFRVSLTFSRLDSQACCIGRLA